MICEADDEGQPTVDVLSAWGTSAAWPAHAERRQTHHTSWGSVYSLGFNPRGRRFGRLAARAGGGRLARLGPRWSSGARAGQGRTDHRTCSSYACTCTGGLVRCR
jgi:hypothetical protein